MSNLFNRSAFQLWAREVPAALRCERQTTRPSIGANGERPVSKWAILTALCLITLWLPVTSHDWLESAGWIHSHEDSAHDAHHEAADGICRLEHGGVLLKAPTLAAQSSLPIAAAELLSAVGEWSFVPVTLIFHSTAPPGLAATWQFSHRTACPNQAPPTLG